MPWKHFQDNSVNEINDTLNLFIRNNQASINVDYQYNVYRDNIIIDHYPSLGISRNITVLDYDSIGNFSFENPPVSINPNVFPPNFSDSTEFLIEHIIGTGVNDFKKMILFIICKNFILILHMMMVLLNLLMG